MVAPDGDAGDRLGYSVSLSGTLALVGAYFDEVGANSTQGSAYIFDCSSLPCILRDRLIAPDGAPNDRFGSSVSLHGFMALVGALGDDIGANSIQGSAYLFDCSSFPCVLQDKLVASDGDSGDAFGNSVSLYGSLALIGAHQDDVDLQVDRGSVYLFDCSSLPCSEVNKIIATDGVAAGRFGGSVSLHGSWALIGSPGDQVGANFEQGSAYLFDCSAFSCNLQDKLNASDGAAFDFFGWSVSFDGSSALVGSYRDDVEGNTDQGSAYLFDCSALPCTHRAKLIAPDGAGHDFFGRAVSLSGSFALVGAHQDDVGANLNQGSAYLFNCASFSCSLVDQLIAQDGAANDELGISVSLSGNMALVGVYLDDIEGNTTQGSAYLIGVFSFQKFPFSFFFFIFLEEGKIRKERTSDQKNE